MPGVLLIKNSLTNYRGEPIFISLKNNLQLNLKNVTHLLTNKDGNELRFYNTIKRNNSLAE